MISSANYKFGQNDHIDSFPIYNSWSLDIEFQWQSYQIQEHGNLNFLHI